MTVLDDTLDVTEFTSLSEEEQSQVAERLLKLAESNWRPFWCPDPNCDGFPHIVLDADGDETYVGIDAKAGPNSEPLSPVVYETPAGELFLPTRRMQPVLTGPLADQDKPYGRLVYDPSWAHNHARVDQRLPGWAKPWILFIMSGRGSGKTRTGIEFVTLSARKGLDGAIIGRRGTELVNTHVAEIQKHAHPDFYPEHFASKDILVWPNGAITYLFSAERPENIRSVNLSYAWFDEAAHMDEIEKAWVNARFAARVKSPGNPIHILITSTPTGTPWVVKMEDDPKVIVRRVSTYANEANLDDDFIEGLEEEYEGTRTGRQELHGEVLRDVEGAMWNEDLFDHLRFDAVGFLRFLETMDDRVLAVDPAGSKGPRSDAHGIIGVGVQHFDENGDPLPGSRFFVLGDATLKGTPSDRSERVFKAARLWNVSRIIVEKNFGGDDVKQGLEDYALLHPEMACNADGEAYKIELVHASVSKETRAEPTVGKYEQGRVTHVTSKNAYGDLSMLEKEQVMWVPKSRGGRMPSPNRIDALVWAVRDLERKVRHATQMAGANVMSKIKRRA